MGLMNFTPEGEKREYQFTVVDSSPVRLGHALFLTKEFILKDGNTVLVRNKDYTFERMDERLYREKGMVCFTAVRILSQKYFRKKLSVGYYAVGDYIDANVFDNYYQADRIDDLLSVKLDQSEFQKEKTIINQSIADEATARRAADNTLQGNINAEAVARQTADNTLQGNINAEAVARQRADNTLQGNINAEAVARQRADDLLQEEIDNNNLRIAEVSLRKIENVILERNTGMLKFILGGYSYDLPETNKSNQGRFFKVDTLLEKIAVNFRYDETARDLVITLDDGTEQRVDLSDLFDMQRVATLEEQIKKCIKSNKENRPKIYVNDYPYISDANPGDIVMSTSFPPTGREALDRIKIVKGVGASAGGGSIYTEYYDILMDKDIVNDLTSDDGSKVLSAKQGKLLKEMITTGNYLHPATHPASIIVQDTNNRFMTDAERTKLAGIATGANNYIHPNDANTRHVTDVEKATWNGKQNNLGFIPVRQVGSNVVHFGWTGSGVKCIVDVTDFGHIAFSGHGHSASEITETTSRKFLSSQDLTNLRDMANVIVGNIEHTSGSRLEKLRQLITKLNVYQQKVSTGSMADEYYYAYHYYFNMSSSYSGTQSTQYIR